MKHGLLGLCLVLLTASAPLAAAPVTFDGFLSGPNEEPPNASPGTGFTSVTIDPDAHTLRVFATFSGLIGLTTASHIHVINGPGDADTSDTNGPVATAVPTFPDFPLDVSAGSYDRTFDTLSAASYNPAFVTNAGGLAQAEMALFAGIMEGRAYLNIHSTFARGGEIRDFLEPVPEPATAGIAAAALLALAVRSRRRRRAA
jgi:hypothetical protein